MKKFTEKPPVPSVTSCIADWLPPLVKIACLITWEIFFLNIRVKVRDLYSRRSKVDNLPHWNLELLLIWVPNLWWFLKIYHVPEIHESKLDFFPFMTICRKLEDMCFLLVEDLALQGVMLSPIKIVKSRFSLIPGRYRVQGFVAKTPMCVGFSFC